MAGNQLADEGAVIGYRPGLEYKKQVRAVSDSEEVYENTEQDSGGIAGNLSNNSITCQYFAQNVPSYAISTLETVSDELKTLVDNLASAFSSGKWAQYSNIESLITAMEYNNDEYIGKFVNFHKYNIAGSIVPELIMAVYDADKRINLVSDTLKRLYYNKKHITSEEMAEIDAAYINKIASYEKNDQKCKINYITISNDALLNKSTMSYAYSVNEACIDLSEIVDTEISDIYTNRDKVNVVKNLFFDANNGIDKRNSAYERYQTVEILEKTLYNYYYKRQELLDLYDLLYGEAPIFLGTKIVEKQKGLEEAIQNINRAYLGNSSHIEKLRELEEEKYYLLNIYGQLSALS